MPFDINEFSQNIAEFGVFENNRYDVSITLPPILQNLNSGTSNNSSFPFLSSWPTLVPMRACQCTTPGLVFMSHETYNLGVGKKIKQPYNAAFVPLRIGLIADTQGIIEDTLNLWMNMIFQYSYDSSGFSTFLANYRTYTLSPNITINKYDRMGNIVNTYNLVGGIPTVLSNQELQWAAGNSLMMINVTFDYASYTII